MKRPYECKVATCDKSYTTRFSLRRHIASHSAIKQHVCVLCFKTFTLAQYLKEHTYIHTQQKPFKCDFDGCTRAFRQAGKLSMHKKVHQNIIFAVHRVKRNRIDPANAAPQVESKTVNATPASPVSNDQASIEEQKSPSLVTILTKQQQQQQVHEFGEDTEHELSLSRNDDSDLSIISDSEEEIVEPRRPEAPVVQEQEDENDNSESLESSFMEEESEYDEEAQRKEEISKLSKIFEKTGNRGAAATSANPTNKVKFPYDMLIEKLIDSLDTPDLIRQKQLPLPECVEPMAHPVAEPDQEMQVMAQEEEEEEVKPAKQIDSKQPGVFEQMYAAKTTAATAIGDNLLDSSAMATHPQQVHYPAKQIIDVQQQAYAPFAYHQQVANAGVQYIQLAQGAQLLQHPQAQHQLCYQLQPQIQLKLAHAQPTLQLVQLVPVQLTTQLQPQALQPILTTLQYAAPSSQMQTLI